MAHALWVRPAINAMKELLFVQEEIAGQYALIAQFLEEIAGRYGHLTKGILRIPGLPACENLPCFCKLLLVQEIESSVKLRHGREGRCIAARYFRGKTHDWAQQQHQNEDLRETQHVSAPSVVSMPLIAGRNELATRQPQAKAHRGDQAECFGISQDAGPSKPVCCKFENPLHNPPRGPNVQKTPCYPSPP